MRKPTLALVFVALAFLVPACSGGFFGLFEQGDDARDAWVLPDEMGAIYKSECKVCHGGGFEGSSLGPSLLSEKLVHGDSIDELASSITNGFPNTRMLAWKDALSAADIRGLAIFIAEKRIGDYGDKGNGVGPPPVIPTEAFGTELHSFVITPVYGGLSEPYSIAPLPDGRVLVTEKMRGLSIVEADGSTATLVTGTPTFYDDAELRGTAYAGNGWIHEVELHPRFSENGWIYISYGDRCEGCNAVSIETARPVSMVKLIRGRLDGHSWVDEETIWEAPKDSYIDGLENGAAARIAFDDAGYVYLVVGSLAGYEGIQDLDQPNGKIHRVHDDGRIPEDNPFVGRPGALPSIYTLGHRNPQGIDFDPETRQMWSSEHGPRGGDEANLIQAGMNYGWPMVSMGVDYDGRPISYAKKLGIEFDPADLEPAKIDWTPSPGVSSIVFYRGEAFENWNHHLLVATLSRNDLWRVVVDAEKGAIHTETLIEGLGRFRDIEVGPSGEIFVLIEHRAGSQILRIEPAGA